MPDAATPLRTAVVLATDAALREALAAALAADGLTVLESTAAATKLDALAYVADPVPGSIAGTSAGALGDAMAGVLRGAFQAVQRGAAALRAKGDGGAVVIVAPASAAHGAHDATRQGLRLLTKSAALELGPEGIRVNIVLPGGGESPLGGACTVADIAASVAFAASPRACFMTGADLVVDGGRAAL